MSDSGPSGPLVSFAIVSHGKERACCYALLVLLMRCECLSSLTLPHGAKGWSEVFYCVISRSYSLTSWEAEFFF